MMYCLINQFGLLGASFKSQIKYARRHTSANMVAFDKNLNTD